MGLFNNAKVVDAVEAFLQKEEIFAAKLNEEYDTALSALTRARGKAASRVEQLKDIAAVAKNQADTLIDSFGERE